MPIAPYDPDDDPEPEPYLPDFDEILDRILNGDEERSSSAGRA
jgi:hypothetical protein